MFTVYTFYGVMLIFWFFICKLLELDVYFSQNIESKKKTGSPVRVINWHSTQTLCLRYYKHMITNLEQCHAERRKKKKLFLIHLSYFQEA